MNKLAVELNSKLWQGEELISEVKEKLLEIANNFLAFLKEDEIELKLKDVLIIGSNANFNYTDESDIDLHIIVDMSDIEDEEEKRLLLILYNAYKSLFNNKYDPIIKGHEVEIYVEPEETQTASGGVFSLMNGWARVPSKGAFNSNEASDKEFETEFKKWENKYNALLNTLNIDLDSINSIDLEEDKKIHKSETITTYNGSIHNDENYKNINLMKSKELGIHCGTKLAVKARGYKYIYELKLSNFNILKLKFDMTVEWGGLELASKLTTDADELKMLKLKLRTFSNRKDKREQYSKIYRDFILSKGYNLISYINKVEDKDTTGYIIIDTSTIISAKLIEEENLSAVETDKLAEIDKFVKDIYDLRKASLKKGGENSVGNKVFKQFRRLGYLKTLKDAKIAFENKEMSLESLYEAVKGISDRELFWHLRDGLTDKQGEFLNKTDYSEPAKQILETLEGNLYLNKGKIDILSNQEAEGKFAVSPEQYSNHLLDKEGMKRFKKVVKGETIMFYNSTDEFGHEYSVLTSDEEACIKALKGELDAEFAKQQAFGAYINGEYHSVTLEDIENREKNKNESK